MKFNNLNDLFKKIENDIQDTMINEVAENAKDEMIDAVQTSVYSVYDPVEYIRRYGNGGLVARENIKVDETDNGIMLKDIAPLDNGRTDYALDDIIVNRGVLGYPQGRDFYSETIEHMENNGRCIKVLKDGLKKRGYEVK